MFDDYKRSVLAGYEKQKASGTLSLNLTHITPANLKSECTALCEAGIGKKDEKLLRSFFGQKEDATAYRQAIRNCEADRFRPLANFLKQKTADTDEKNIELLAWLIGFEPRPYQAGQVYTATHKTAIETAADVPQANPLNNIPMSKGKRKIIIPAVVLLLTGAAIYLALHKQSPATLSTRLSPGGKEECMYWTGERYQPVSCSQKLGDTAVIALDSFKVAHFKKIMQPDTLTGYSVKKVWYAKINGGIEFYTAPGFHPLHSEKRLLPLTVYILNKYVRHN